MEEVKRIRVKSDDALVRLCFADPVVVTPLFQTILPASIVEKLDWSTLQKEAFTGVSNDLRAHHTDLFFSIHAKTGGPPIGFLLLLEHQSRPDRWSSLRMLEYQMLAWKEWRSEHKSSRKLPVIIPIILFLGRQAWRAPRSLRKLLAMPAGMPESLVELLPNCGYLLADLSPQAHAQLPQEPLARAVLEMMQSAKRKDLPEQIGGIVQRLAQHPHTEHYRQIAGYLYEYVCYQTPKNPLSRAAYGAIFLDNLPEEEKEDFMSIAEALIQDGHAKGLAEGSVKGRVEGRVEGRMETLQQGVLDVLEIRFERVPEGLREVILGLADAAVLKVLHREAVKAASIEAFVDRMP